MIFSAFATSLLLLPSYVFGHGNILAGCAQTYYDAAHDYFPDKVQSKYSSGFEITYQGNAKYIRNSIAQETYVLYQCGTPAPSHVTPTPANSLQVSNWTKVVAVPGAKVNLDSAPASAAIEMLEAQHSVAAAYTYFAVTSPCMQKRLASVPRISQNFNVPGAAQRRRRHQRNQRNRLDRRVWYDIEDLGLQWTFTTYGMSDPRSISVNPEDAQDMLGKAEWIKFVAAFYNKEAEANRLFGQIEAKYRSLKTERSQQRPATVGVARYNKAANGTVLGWSIDPVQSWMAQGLADAGMAVHSGSSSYRSIGAFYQAVSGWDIMVDVSSEPLSHGGATLPEWSDLVHGYRLDSGEAKMAKMANAIYRTDLISSYKNATDYNEHLQVRSDLLLEDLIKLAGSAANGTTSAKWYRNMPQLAPVNWQSASDCQ